MNGSNDIKFAYGSKLYLIKLIELNDKTIMF